MNKKFWNITKEVITLHNKENDTLIKEVMKRSNFRFGAKKLAFTRDVRMTDLVNWEEHVDEYRAMGRRITKKKVTTLNNYALNLIVDLLRNMNKAEALHYDPVGTENNVRAELIRKSNIGRNQKKIMETLFDVPDMIKRLDYLDHDTIPL